MPKRISAWLLLGGVSLALLMPSCAMKKDVITTQSEVAVVRGNLQDLVSSIDKRQAGMSEEILELKRTASALKSRDDELRQTLVAVQQKINVSKIETDENLRHLTDLNREYQKSQDANLRKISDGISASLRDTGVRIADLKSRLDEIHALEDDQNRRLGETANRLNVFLEEVNAETDRLAKALQEIARNYNLLADRLNALNKEVAAVKEGMKSAAAPRTHVVREGETLSAIAGKYGLSAEELIRFNGLSNPDNIQVGQKLLLSGP